MGNPLPCSFSEKYFGAPPSVRRTLLDDALQSDTPLLPRLGGSRALWPGGGSKLHGYLLLLRRALRACALVLTKSPSSHQPPGAPLLRSSRLRLCSTWACSERHPSGPPTRIVVRFLLLLAVPRTPHHTQLLADTNSSPAWLREAWTRKARRSRGWCTGLASARASRTTCYAWTSRRPSSRWAVRWRSSTWRHGQ